MHIAELQQALKVLRPVAQRAEDGFKRYVMKDEQLMVQTGYITASVPVMSTETLVVPKDPFERCVSVMRGDPVVDVGPKRISFRSGKTVVYCPNIKKDDEVFEFSKLSEDDPAAEVYDIDAGFLNALRLVQPLIEDRPSQDWMHSAVIANGRISGVFRGQVMLSVPYAPLENVTMLMPSFFAQLAQQASSPPAVFIRVGNAIQIEFADESWIKSQMLEGAPPKRLFSLLDKEVAAWIDIPQELREAVVDAGKYGCDDVRITQEGVFGQTDAGEFEARCTTGVGDRSLRYSMRSLNMSFPNADQWAVDAWPNPTVFRKDDVLGFMSGLGG